MTAHPIDLIAGMNDGLDPDEQDRVTRHIASCDVCRTTARTMQRVDGLIALPEPALPLPQRVAPRQHVRVAGWASVVTVVLTLAVATAVLVESLRDTQAGSGVRDTCELLTAAARSAGVRSPSAKAFPIELRPPLSGSWTACAYGDSAERADRTLLFRSPPTASRNVPDVLAALVTSGANELSFGQFWPALAVDGTERWTTEPFSRLSAGPAMAVLAEPYFFVVTAPGPDATDRLVEAVLAELRRRPWPPLSGAAKIDACRVITRAAPAAGLTAEPNFAARRHWGEVPAATLRSWGWNNVCAFPGDQFDGHLWIREEPTTALQATDLLRFVSQTALAFSSTSTPTSVRTEVGDWVQIEPGMWLVNGRATYTGCRDCPLEIAFSAVAVFDEPHFFVLTQATDAAAIRTARAVLAELRRP